MHPNGRALRGNKDVLETIGAFVVRVRIVVRKAITKKAGVRVRGDGETSLVKNLVRSAVGK